jgi:hypothetical protein
VSRVKEVALPTMGKWEPWNAVSKLGKDQVRCAV